MRVSNINTNASLQNNKTNFKFIYNFQNNRQLMVQYITYRIFNVKTLLIARPVKQFREYIKVYSINKCHAIFSIPFSRCT